MDGPVQNQTMGNDCLNTKLDLVTKMVPLHIRDAQLTWLSRYHRVKLEPGIAIHLRNT